MAEGTRNSGAVNLTTGESSWPRPVRRTLRSSPKSEPTWDAPVGLSDSSQRPSDESLGSLKLLRDLERSI